MFAIRKWVALLSVTAALLLVLLYVYRHPGYVDSLGSGHSLPTNILIADINGDGRKDINVVYHAESRAEYYQQVAKREFDLISQYKNVGFHPGDLIEWPDAQGHLILGAEGEKTIKALSFVQKERSDRKGDSETWEPTVISKRSLPDVRHLEAFKWPGWGTSLVVQFFQHDSVGILKNLSINKMGLSEVIGIPLSQNPPSVRNASRFYVGDIDEDSIDEILFVSTITKEVFVIKYPGETNKPEARVLLRDDAFNMSSIVKGLDVAGDQSIDLIVPDEAGSGGLHILENKGGLRFEKKQFVENPFPTSVLFQPGIRQLEPFVDKNGDKFILVSALQGLVLYKIGHDKRLSWERKLVLSEAVETSYDMKVEDLDGDGFQDVVLGRSGVERNIMIIYGPLWGHFEDLVGMGYVLH